MTETEGGQPCPHGRWTGVCVPCMDAEYKKWITRVGVAYAAAVVIIIMAGIVFRSVYPDWAGLIAVATGLIVMAAGIYVLRLTAPARRWTR